MKSLHTRLDPIKEQVLRFTRLFGRFEAMNEFQVADYKCFTDWLEEVTCDKNYGINPEFCSHGSQRVLNQVATKVVRTLLDLQVENKRLREENAVLKAELNRGDGSDVDQALAIMEVCQV